jgi:hypothetical protein
LATVYPISSHRLLFPLKAAYACSSLPLAYALCTFTCSRLSLPLSTMNESDSHSLCCCLLFGCTAVPTIAHYCRFVEPNGPPSSSTLLSIRAMLFDPGRPGNLAICDFRGSAPAAPVLTLAPLTTESLHTFTASRGGSRLGMYGSLRPI